MRKGVLMTCAALLVMTTSHTFAQTTTSFVPYATPNRGADSIETVGGTGPLAVGYGRALPSSSTTPAGFEIIGLDQNGVRISEAGVPGTTILTSGRTYAEVNGAINTAVAFVNPIDVPVIVSFHFTDSSGRDSNQGTFTLNAGAQIARFLTEAPFNSRTFTGTFTFVAPTPVAVAALRTLVNESGTFLMTAQTIAPLPTATSAGIVIVPDFVDAAGWRTQVILINPSDTASTGTVEFFNEGSATADATALTISVNGATASVFNYTIAAGAAASFVTSSQGTNVLTGSVRVTPTGGTIPPAVFAVISFVNGGVTQFQTTVQTLPPANALRSYVEMRDAIQNATTQTDRIQSAVAIANNSAAAATVNFELTTMDGTMVVPTATVNIPAFGHTSRFIRDLFPTIDLPFQGVLRISSFSSVVVAAFRTRNNKLGTFLMAATPVTNEASPTSTADLFFPNIANGGGYATQFIFFSGITQQNTTGALRFVRPDGLDLNLPIR